MNISPKNSVSHRWLDPVFEFATRFFAIVVLSLLAAILGSLLYGAMPSIEKFGMSFLTTAEWNPPEDEYGALVPIMGTLATSFLALFIALPVSFGIALFLTEMSPKWLKRPLGTAIELLAAVPSIIYGMWGLFVIVPLFMEYVQPNVIKLFSQIPMLNQLFAGPSIGVGIFTAGVILSIMIIPYITAVMRDVFEVVPALMKESAYGLGATTWEVVWTVVLPYTKSGVIGGVMLGLGRALGETMAVTFVIGNAHRFSLSLFSPGNSIASTLANEFAEASSPLHSGALIELGLILFLITTIVLGLSKLMLARLRRNEGA
jgi:phosphate transport system permease protein